jgi:hypothetical protein
MRLFRLQCSDAMAPGACPPASPSVAFGFGRRGMQGATRRDSEADGDTGLWRHCRAYVEMEWCVPTAEKLSGIATPTCTSPPRPRAHARTDKKVMLAASQVRAGAVVAIGIYEYDRPTPGSVRASVGKTKARAGGGHGGGAGVRRCTVHYGRTSPPPTCSRGNLYVPTMALFTRGFARRRRSCSSGYSWNGWTERKGTCSSEHEACCAGWVPSDVLWSPRTLAAWLLMVMEGAGRQAV